MNVSEPDLIPVKILSKSVEKQKSYSIFPKDRFFFVEIFKGFGEHVRSDNDMYNGVSFRYYTGSYDPVRVRGREF